MGEIFVLILCWHVLYDIISSSYVALPYILVSFSRKRNQQQQQETNIPREWKYLQCLILQSSAVPVQ